MSDTELDQAIRRWAVPHGLTIYTPTAAQGPHHCWLIEGQKTRFIIGVHPLRDGQLRASAWLVEADGRPRDSEGFLGPDLKVVLDAALTQVVAWLEA